MDRHTTGIDIVEIDRIARVLARFGERFLTRIYTPAEVALRRGRIPELAARFAAKEATMKALGTGVRGVAWRDIEVLPNRRGKPLLILHGTAAARAARIGLKDVDVTLTHARDYAAAVVVAHVTDWPEEENTPRLRWHRPATGLEVC
ncbi:MAG: holo-[acyl-carrier-protein] synthase [Chloroflexota bacterium]